jgi:hypothetical protein
VQAANYDTGGQGVAYNVTSVNGTANSYRSDGVDLEACTDTGCGDDIGWTSAGQWFNYTVNVSTARSYTVTLRLASPSGVTAGRAADPDHRPGQRRLERPPAHLHLTPGGGPALDTAAPQPRTTSERCTDPGYAGGPSGVDGIEVVRLTRYAAVRDAGGDPLAKTARPRLIDGFMGKKRARTSAASYGFLAAHARPHRQQV